MKTLKFLLLALLAVSMVTACSENDTPEEKRELTGTKWKLAALVDIQTGESIFVETRHATSLHVPFIRFTILPFVRIP
jgi:hypothetical protein